MNTSCRSCAYYPRVVVAVVAAVAVTSWTGIWLRVSRTAGGIGAAGGVGDAVRFTRLNCCELCFHLHTNKLQATNAAEPGLRSGDPLPALAELGTAPPGVARLASKTALPLVPIHEPLGVGVSRCVLVLDLDLITCASEALLGSGYEDRGDASSLPLPVHNEEAPMATTLFGPWGLESGAHATDHTARSETLAMESQVQNTIGRMPGVPHAEAIDDLILRQALVGPVMPWWQLIFDRLKV